MSWAKAREGNASKSIPETSRTRIKRFGLSDRTGNWETLQPIWQNCSRNRGALGRL